MASEDEIVEVEHHRYWQFMFMCVDDDTDLYFAISRACGDYESLSETEEGSIARSRQAIVILNLLRDNQDKLSKVYPLFESSYKTTRFAVEPCMIPPKATEALLPKQPIEGASKSFSLSKVLPDPLSYETLKTDLTTICQVYVPLGYLILRSLEPDLIGLILHQYPQLFQEVVSVVYKWHLASGEERLIRRPYTTALAYMIIQELESHKKDIGNEEVLDERFEKACYVLHFCMERGLPVVIDNSPHGLLSWDTVASQVSTKGDPIARNYPNLFIYALVFFHPKLLLIMMAAGMNPQVVINKDTEKLINMIDEFHGQRYFIPSQLVSNKRIRKLAMDYWESAQPLHEDLQYFEGHQPSAEELAEAIRNEPGLEADMRDHLLKLIRERLLRNAQRIKKEYNMPSTTPAQHYILVMDSLLVITRYYDEAVGLITSYKLPPDLISKDENTLKRKAEREDEIEAYLHMAKRQVDFNLSKDANVVRYPLLNKQKFETQFEPEYMVKLEFNPRFYRSQLEGLTPKEKLDLNRMEAAEKRRKEFEESLAYIKGGEDQIRQIKLDRDATSSSLHQYLSSDYRNVNHQSYRKDLESSPIPHVFMEVQMDFVLIHKQSEERIPSNASLNEEEPSKTYILKNGYDRIWQERNSLDRSSPLSLFWRCGPERGQCLILWEW